VGLATGWAGGALLTWVKDLAAEQFYVLCEPGSDVLLHTYLQGEFLASTSH
jgi:hypothetical protein